MAIRVEFYGIARQRAGASELELDADAAESPLESVLDQIVRKLPGFGEESLIEGRLHPALAANLDGERFVSDPATPIRDGQCLLILSADAGG